MKLTERQEKLDKIVTELDENYGIGNGYVYPDTDVDEFIKDLINELMVEHDFSEILCVLNESQNKTYMEMLNEI